jgi:hypothetical protein
MAPTITLTTVLIIGAKIAKAAIPRRRQKAEIRNWKLETGELICSLFLPVSVTSVVKAFHHGGHRGTEKAESRK